MLYSLCCTWSWEVTVETGASLSTPTFCASPSPATSWISLARIARSLARSWLNLAGRKHVGTMADERKTAPLMFYLLSELSAKCFRAIRCKTTVRNSPFSLTLYFTTEHKVTVYTCHCWSLLLFSYRAISALWLDQFWKASPPSWVSSSESLLRGFARRVTTGWGRARGWLRGLWEAEEGWERLCLGVLWFESYSSSEVEV